MGTGLIRISGWGLRAAEACRRYPAEEWLVECGEPPVKPWYTIQDMAYQKRDHKRRQPSVRNRDANANAGK